MTFPTVASEASSQHDTDTTTHTVTMPSGVAAGDLLVAAVAFDGRPAVSGQIVDDWFLLVNTAHSGDLCAIRVYYRTADGTEGASQTIDTGTAECSAHHVWRITGQALAAPEAAIFQGTTSTSSNPPALNPAAWDVEDTLWLALSSSDDGSTTVVVYPTSYTGTGQVNADSSADGVTLGYARRDNAVASENPDTFVISATEAFCTATIAIRPAQPIEWVATGTKAGTGTTTQALDYPAGVAAGRLAIAGRNAWNELATTAAETGWSNHTDLLGGLIGTNTADSHQGRVAVDTLELTGSETGSVTFDQGGTVSGVIGLIMLYAKTAGATWDIATVTGDDDTHAADRSVTATGSVSLQPGDVVVAVAAVDRDAALSVAIPAVTASGITFGAAIRRTTGAGVATGTDGNIEVFDAAVTAGTGTAAPTLTFNSGGGSQCGPVAFVRLRAVTSGTVNATLAGALGGTATAAATVDHPATLVASLGGTGTATAARVIDATAAAALGGTATATAATVIAASADAALGATATATATPDHPATFTAILGGTATAVATVTRDAVAAADLGFTATATATVTGGEISATFDAALGGTADATATVDHPAALTASLGATATATATPDHPATFAAPLGGTASASAEVTHDAAASADLGFVAVAVATIAGDDIAAALAAALGATATATAVVGHPAVAAATLGGTATATATPELLATATASLGGTATAAAGVAHGAVATADLGFTATAVAAVPAGPDLNPTIIRLRESGYQRIREPQ